MTIMQLYQFLNADSTAVLQTETRRCIYLDQPPTIHTEAYIKWRDGWTETIPADPEADPPLPESTIEHPAHTTDPYVAPAPLPPPPAPNRIEALNGLLVLDQAGLGAAYTAWATSPDRTFAQRAFIEKAIYWRRDDPTLAAAAAAFGLTSEQVDGLFAQADQL